MQMLSKVGFVRIGGEGLVGGFDGMAVDRGIDIRLQIAGRQPFQGIASPWQQYSVGSQ